MMVLCHNFGVENVEVWEVAVGIQIVHFRETIIRDAIIL